MRIIVNGLFGGHNFGDELFSKVIVEKINQTEGLGTPFLFTENEQLSRENIEHFEAITGYPFPNKGFQNWKEAISAYRRSGGLLFGGGGLFNEVFLRAGIPGRGIVLATARLFGIPYIIHGVEIGYVGSSLNRYITSWSLRHAHRVIFRNQQSIDRAQEMAGMTPELGIDLNHGWLQRKMSPPTQHGGKPRMIINLQHSLQLEDPLIHDLIEQQRAAGYAAVFLVNNQAEYDMVSQYFGRFADEIILAPTVDSTIGVLASGDAFVTERFHFTMGSLHANRPTFVVISSTKVRELVDRIAAAGGTVNYLREAAEEQRAVVSIPGSEKQEQLVASWGKHSDDQLTSAIQDLKSANKGKRGKLQLRYLPAVAFFYGVLVVHYVMDKISPLDNYLDLKKT